MSGTLSHCVQALPASCGSECPGLVLSLFTGSATTTENPDATAGGLRVNAPANLTVTEPGSSRIFFVSLETQPTAAVTVPLSSSDVGEATVTPASLSFDSGNFSFGQVVTVTGVDDAAMDADQTATIQIGAATSADPAYSGISGTPVVVTILDDESPNIFVTESGVNSVTGEDGTTDDYTIVLTTQPAMDVTVNVANFAGGLTNGGPGETLLFTAGACPGPGNWCAAQTITLSAVDDVNIEGNHGGMVTHSVASADPVYAAITPPSVFQVIRDNDFFTFITAATHTGDFDNDPALSGTGAGDGIAEAARFCNADANRPNARNYKALLASPMATLFRRATVAPDAGDNREDWVLVPNGNYYRADGTTLIFTPNTTSIFVFGVAAGTLGGTGAYWSALRVDWRTNNGNSCSGWSSTAGNAIGGNLASLTNNLLQGTTLNCVDPHPLVCVEQRF